MTMGPATMRRPTHVDSTRSSTSDAMVHEPMCVTDKMMIMRGNFHLYCICREPRAEPGQGSRPWSVALLLGGRGEGDQLTFTLLYYKSFTKTPRGNGSPRQRVCFQLSWQQQRVRTEPPRTHRV